MVFHVHLQMFRNNFFIVWIDCESKIRRDFQNIHCFIETFIIWIATKMFVLIHGVPHACTFKCYVIISSLIKYAATLEIRWYFQNIHCSINTFITWIVTEKFVLITSCERCTTFTFIWFVIISLLFRPHSIKLLIYRP